jgi:hypothetical protein
MESQPEMWTSVFFDGNQGKGVVTRLFAILAVEGRFSSKSDFRTEKLMLLLFLLLLLSRVEQEKICCSDSLMPTIACFFYRRAPATPFGIDRKSFQGFDLLNPTIEIIQSTVTSYGNVVARTGLSI